jgi:uncharacterized membrane protein
MTLLSNIQQTGQMSGHMPQPNGNQDLIFTITIILGLIVITLVGLIVGLIYLIYTGRIHFTNKKTIPEKAEKLEEKNKIIDENLAPELPPVSLTPLERKIIEVVLTGHNVLQSDVPNLVNASKSKVSEALTNLEEKKLIQRYKAGRSLTIKYIYNSAN